MLDCWQRINCRSCGGETINVFSMGSQMVSDFPLPGEEPKGSFPLELMRCHSCGLVQLTHTVNPDLLYKGEMYWYRSGINESMRAALKDVVLRATEMTGLGMYDEEVVVDIGANDGTLLSFYPEGITRVAYEPATSLHDWLSPHCHKLFPDYFPASYGLENSTARVVTSIAMFYDLDDPNAFVKEVKRILHEHGLWIIQMADLRLMLSTGGYDNICHEHLEYYSVSALQSLLARHELKILKVEFNSVNGGSMRVYVSHRNSTIPSSPADLMHLRHVIEGEHDYVKTNDPWVGFAERARQQRFELKYLLKGKGKTVDLLGASTKANTMLQWCGLGPSDIRRAIDRDPRKEGRTTITGIPIVGEEEGREDPAEVLLLGPWHFKEGILAREKGKWPVGTTVIIPLPVVEEVEL